MQNLLVPTFSVLEPVLNPLQYLIIPNDNVETGLESTFLFYSSLMLEPVLNLGPYFTISYEE